ncbi:MAG: hypothetical protein IJU43_03445, partial [Lachnospiraceae bacterium]|nr:hypothetical protein [Lachnospiraceae bacterium]
MFRIIKNSLGSIICIALVCAVAGCSNTGSSARTVDQPAGVNEVLKAKMAEEDLKTEGNIPDSATPADSVANERQAGINEGAPEPESVDESEIEAAHTEGIDIDLTALSKNMVYAEVFNMMVTPENYIGKTVKMEGMYTVYHDEATGKIYHACIIADATACCSQGIEFLLTDDYTYPDDYPEEFEDVCIVGVFD